MTGPEPTAPEPVAEPYAVVEALIDGEAVDPGALRRALEQREVRDHLVDLLVLRQGVKDMVPGACAASVRPSKGARRMAWLAAAAAVLISLSAGYYTGQRTVSAAGSQGVEAMVVAESTPAAPKPTQVIKLQRGVNWTDVPGGMK
jgi:hypothetical protein